MNRMSSPSFTVPVGAVPTPFDPRAAVRRPTHRFEGGTMGTRYRVTFVAPDTSDPRVARAHEAVRAAVQRVDALMSTYKPDSDVSAINRARAGRPTVVSPLTMQVIAEAQRVSELSGGAFDVTAGRFVNAWGFGPHKQARVPDDAELDRLARDVGWRRLQVNAPTGAVTKPSDGMYVDLSAIAKGFGTDEASRALSALGLHDHLVDVGGEMRASGLRPDGRPWQVGIEQPDLALAGTARVAVPLRNLSLATSGDYRICFHRDAQRYSHEIDPRTGRPVTHGLALVSVIAASCMEADAMATALLVLGLDAGLALAERLDLAAYFVLREPGGALRDLHSSAFSRLGGRTISTD